jgi:hypothetical protein
VILVVWRFRGPVYTSPSPVLGFAIRMTRRVISINAMEKMI